MVTAAVYVYDWGFVKPTMALQYGFYEDEQAILFALFAILGAIAARAVPFFRSKISDYRGLIVMNLMMSAGFILGFWNWGWWGAGVMLILDLVSSFNWPWISTIVNERIDSGYRATSLSAITFLTKIPYIILTIGAGIVTQKGWINYFHLVIGLLIGAILIYQIKAVAAGSIFKKKLKSKYGLGYNEL